MHLLPRVFWRRAPDRRGHAASNWINHAIIRYQDAAASLTSKMTGALNTGEGWNFQCDLESALSERQQDVGVPGAVQSQCFVQFKVTRADV